VSIAKVRAWLLTRPEPRQPMRRIVPISTSVIAVTFLAVTVGSPPSFRVAVSRLLWLLILALLLGAVILFARAWHRGRKARRARRARGSRA
jgi:hypothetical protein